MGGGNTCDYIFLFVLLAIHFLYNFKLESKIHFPSKHICVSQAIIITNSYLVLNFVPFSIVSDLHAIVFMMGGYMD